MLIKRDIEVFNTQKHKYTYRLSQRGMVWYWKVTDETGKELAGGHNQSRDATVLRCKWDAEARSKEDNE